MATFRSVLERVMRPVESTEEWIEGVWDLRTLITNFLRIHYCHGFKLHRKLTDRRILIAQNCHPRENLNIKLYRGQYD
jgi:hypothetical protein